MRIHNEKKQIIKEKSLRLIELKDWGSLSDAVWPDFITASTELVLEFDDLAMEESRLFLRALPEALRARVLARMAP